MLFDNTALTAFQASSGVAATKLNLFIRTLVFLATMVWGGYCVYGLIHQIRHQSADALDISGKALRILFIITLLMLIVFIPH